MEMMEKERMIQDNMKLFYKYAHEYMRKIKIFDYDFEDYLQVVLLYAWKFLDEFDPNKGSMSNFIHFKIHGRFLDIYKYDKRINKHYIVSSIDANIVNSDNNHESDSSFHELIQYSSCDITDSIIYRDICEKLKENSNIKPIFLDIYKKYKTMNSTECGLLFNKSQTYISRIITVVDLYILKEYGYTLTKDDLNLIDFKLSKDGEKQVGYWKNQKVDELKIKPENTFIYKKLLQKKYHI